MEHSSSTHQAKLMCACTFEPAWCVLDECPRNACCVSFMSLLIESVSLCKRGILMALLVTGLCLTILGMGCFSFTHKCLGWFSPLLSIVMIKWVHLLSCLLSNSNKCWWHVQTSLCEHVSAGATTDYLPESNTEEVSSEMNGSSTAVVDDFESVLDRMRQLHQRFGSSPAACSRMLSRLDHINTASLWENFLRCSSSFERTRQHWRALQQ